MAAPGSESELPRRMGDRVRALMPQLKRDLVDLARIPSVSVPGRIYDALLGAHDERATIAEADLLGRYAEAFAEGAA